MSETGTSDLPAGLSAPARRALDGVGIKKLEDLTRFTEVEIKHLHGLGPTTLVKLREAMTARGLSYAENTKGKPA